MAHPIGALPAYADLAEFIPRRGTARPVSPLSKYCCPVFARLQRLTTHPRSCDRRKPEAQARQRRMPFGVKEIQPIALNSRTSTGKETH